MKDGPPLSRSYDQHSPVAASSGVVTTWSGLQVKHVLDHKTHGDVL